MQNYKDANNKIHFLESAEFAHLLPAGCVPITEAEAEAIRTANIPVPTITQSKDSALTRINSAFESAAAALTAGYPPTECLTWPDQHRETLAWQANNATPTPYLDALALARGMDRLEYVNRTVSKIAMFKAASAALVGKRQKLADQIAAATTAAACDLVVW